MLQLKIKYCLKPYLSILILSFPIPLLSMQMEIVTQNHQTPEQAHKDVTLRQCINPFNIPAYIRTIWRNAWEFDPIDENAYCCGNREHGRLMLDILDGKKSVNSSIFLGSGNEVSLFWHALREMPLEDLQIFIQKGVDINRKMQCYDSAFFELCRELSWETSDSDEMYEKVKLLIRSGANIHYKASDHYNKGYTPLMILLTSHEGYNSAYNFCCAIAKVLINAGANINEKAKDGETAWTLFIKRLSTYRRPIGRFIHSTIRVFLANKAMMQHLDPELITKISQNQAIYKPIKDFDSNQKALFAVIGRDDENKEEADATYETVRNLVKKLPLKTLGQYNDTPLHLAIKKGKYKIALILFGILPILRHEKNELGHTPIILATNGGIPLLRFFMNLFDPENKDDLFILSIKKEIAESSQSRNLQLK